MCQQRNTNVFITQLADRAQEKLVLSKAHQSRSKHASYVPFLMDTSSCRMNRQGQ
jgi:hypothetical protein